MDIKPISLIRDKQLTNQALLVLDLRFPFLRAYWPNLNCELIGLYYFVNYSL